MPVEAQYPGSCDGDGDDQATARRECPSSSQKNLVNNATEITSGHTTTLAALT
jgi:hypothetical protein